MSTEEDEAYLEARAEAELSLAQSAKHPGAVRAHYLLAGYYLDRLYNPGDEELRAGNESWAGRGRY
jgi:hypothetical protein